MKIFDFLKTDREKLIRLIHLSWSIFPKFKFSMKLSKKLGSRSEKCIKNQPNQTKKGGTIKLIGIDSS